MKGKIFVKSECKGKRKSYWIKEFYAIHFLFVKYNFMQWLYQYGTEMNLKMWCITYLHILFFIFWKKLYTRAPDFVMFIQNQIH